MVELVLLTQELFIMVFFWWSYGSVVGKFCGGCCDSFGGNNINMKKNDDL